jgi:hypothetical protein
MTDRPEYSPERVAYALDKVTALATAAKSDDAPFCRVESIHLRTILSALAKAEGDSKRLAILNAAIEDDRLYVDGNSLPPVSAYPPDEDEAYVVYDLTDAADELIAHAEKLAAMTKEGE